MSHARNSNEPPSWLLQAICRSSPSVYRHRHRIQKESTQNEEKQHSSNTFPPQSSVSVRVGVALCKAYNHSLPISRKGLRKRKRNALLSGGSRRRLGKTAHRRNSSRGNAMYRLRRYLEVNNSRSLAPTTNYKIDERAVVTLDGVAIGSTGERDMKTQGTNPYLQKSSRKDLLLSYLTPSWAARQSKYTKMAKPLYPSEHVIHERTDMHTALFRSFVQYFASKRYPGEVSAGSILSHPSIVLSGALIQSKHIFPGWGIVLQDTELHLRVESCWLDKNVNTRVTGINKKFDFHKRTLAKNRARRNTLDNEGSNKRMEQYQIDKLNFTPVTLLVPSAGFAERIVNASDETLLIRELNIPLFGTLHAEPPSDWEYVTWTEYEPWKYPLLRPA